MNKFFQSFFLFLWLPIQLLSYEKADAFIVKVYDEKVRVLSPTQYDPNLSVIVENKTLLTLKAKVVTESEQSVRHLSIEPGKSTHVKLQHINKEKIFFIPLSPPLQKVELKLGSKPYEIPPRS
jgi:hypothetical protein